MGTSALAITMERPRARSIKFFPGFRSFKYRLPDYGDPNLFPVLTMHDSTCLIRPGMDASINARIKVDR